MLEVPSPEAALRFGEYLDELGYNAKALRAIGLAEPPLAGDHRVPRMLDRTEEPTPFNLLYRLFILGTPVWEGTAGSMFPEWVTAFLLAHGLVEVEEDDLVPRVGIARRSGCYIVSDPGAENARAIEVDQVPTPSPSAGQLLLATIRRPVRRLLDLGTGCGVQALAAASHAERVTATDLNERAALFTEIGARLNGFENIECLTGDRFEPVAGRIFDQIIANPPFILAPRKRFTFSDNEMELDSFCRSVVRGAPEHLAEGGFCQIICEWVTREGEAREDWLADWFEGLGCDAWILHAYAREPWQYVETRMREASQGGVRAPAAMYDEWMSYYREKRVVSMHGGLIALRKRSGSNWIHFEEQGVLLTQPFGDAVLDRFAALDFLEAARDDDAILRSVLRLAESIKLEQDYIPGDGEWSTVVLRLRHMDGLQEETTVDGNVATFLLGLDGRSTLGMLAAREAERLGIEESRVIPSVVAVMRKMIALGFVVPGRASTG